MKQINKYSVLLMFIAAMTMTWTQVAAQQQTGEDDHYLIASKKYNKWNTSKQFVAGFKAFDSDAYDDALKQFEKEVKLHPGNGYALCNLGIVKKIIAFNKTRLLFYDIYSSEIMSIDSLETVYEKILHERDVNYLLAVADVDKGISLMPAADKESLSKAYLRKGKILEECNDKDLELTLETYKKSIEILPTIKGYEALISFYKDIMEDEITANDYRIEAYNIFGDKCGSDILVALAQHYYNEGQADKSLDIVDKLLQSNPDNYSALNVQASVFKAQKKYDAYLDNVIKLANSGQFQETSSELIELASESEENYNLVINKLRQAQRNHSDEDLMNWHIVEGYVNFYQSHDYRQALECFKTGVKLSENSFIYARIADCYYRLGEVDQALQVMDDAVVMRVKEYNKDEEENDESSTIDKYGILSDKIDMEMRLGLVDKVINDSRVMLILTEADDKDNKSSACLALEWAYKAQGKLKEALAYNDKWSEIDPNNVNVRYRQASTLWDLDHRDEATSILRGILSNEDNFAQNNELKFNVLCRLGETDEAQKILDELAANTIYVNDLTEEQINELDSVPEIMSYYNLACGYSIMGDAVKALSFLRKHYEEGSGSTNPDFDYAILDDDFNNIRQNPEFMATINRYKQQWLNGNLKPLKK